MKKNKKTFISRRGYTMIELMVALSIFVTVIVVVLGLFSMAIKGQRRVIAQQNVQENARFLMEFMTKEIRMSVITSSNGASPNLALTRSDGDSVTYSISGGKILRNGSQVSSDEIIVTGSFYIEGRKDPVSINDYLQPKVTITLGIQGAGSQAEEKSKMNIQATLSQRNLDL